MAAPRYRRTSKIVAKLHAAGIGKPRDEAVIQAEIVAVETLLRRLRKEAARARASAIMRRVRSSPEFEARRLAGLAKMAAAPGYHERRKEIAARTPRTTRLPPMTEAQRKLYQKLRWANKQSREVALAAVIQPAAHFAQPAVCPDRHATDVVAGHAAPQPERATTFPEAA